MWNIYPVTSANMLAMPVTLDDFETLRVTVAEILSTWLSVHSAQLTLGSIEALVGPIALEALVDAAGRRRTYLDRSLTPRFRLLQLARSELGCTDDAILALYDALVFVGKVSVSPVSAYGGLHAFTMSSPHNEIIRVGTLYARSELN